MKSTLHHLINVAAQNKGHKEIVQKAALCQNPISVSLSHFVTLSLSINLSFFPLSFFPSLSLSVFLFPLFLSLCLSFPTFFLSLFFLSLSSFSLPLSLSSFSTSLFLFLSLAPFILGSLCQCLSFTPFHPLALSLYLSLNLWLYFSCVKTILSYIIR